MKGIVGQKYGMNRRTGQHENFYNQDKTDSTRTRQEMTKVLSRNKDETNETRSDSYEDTDKTKTR